jgi:hypothetical protein
MRLFSPGRMSARQLHIRPASSLVGPEIDAGDGVFQDRDVDACLQRRQYRLLDTVIGGQSAD